MHTGGHTGSHTGGHRGMIANSRLASRPSCQAIIGVKPMSSFFLFFFTFFALVWLIVCISLPCQVFFLFIL